jgi:exonuclease VII small subunit
MAINKLNSLESKILELSDKLNDYIQGNGNSKKLKNKSKLANKKIKHLCKKVGSDDKS